MSAIEYANRLLGEITPGKRARSTIQGYGQVVFIICTDGSTERITGCWAEWLTRCVTEPEGNVRSRGIRAFVRKQ